MASLLVQSFSLAQVGSEARCAGEAGSPECLPLWGRGPSYAFVFVFLHVPMQAGGAHEDMK